MKKKITISEEIDLVNYMDAKVTQIVNSQRMWKRWAITSIILIALALISSGYVNIKAVSDLENRTELIYKEYIPGDLFLAIIHSFDLQNRYTLSLLNGNIEEAEKAYQEFIAFRDQIYKEHFRTRGPSPFDGRTLNSVK